MARLNKRLHADHHYQPRGWGSELWIENIPDYCGKILYIQPGKKGSLHYHLLKTETMYVEEGSMTLRLIDPESAQEYRVDLVAGESILIPAGQVHQIINSGYDTLRLYEFSTQHFEDDSRRVQKGD